MCVYEFFCEQEKMHPKFVVWWKYPKYVITSVICWLFSLLWSSTRIECKGTVPTRNRYDGFCSISEYISITCLNIPTIRNISRLAVSHFLPLSINSLTLTLRYLLLFTIATITNDSHSLSSFRFCFVLIDVNHGLADEAKQCRQCITV